jgi:alanine or glycine:cation symporter, AGCS family
MRVRSALAALWLVLTALAAPLALPEPALAQQPPGQIDRPDTAPPATLGDPSVAPEAEQPGGGLFGRADAAMGRVNTWIGEVFFFDLWFWDNPGREELDAAAAAGEPAPRQVVLPFVVLWLVLGAIYFTIRMGFINIRAFGHAVQVVRGRYSDPTDAGEVSHFQALSTALSATVGLGNIAGVAIAVSIGGPGATFWMILAGLLGMSAKFAECTLGQQYREVRSDGRIMGGAMEYLSRGLREKGWPRLGMVLAVLFSVLCIGGSLAGGNSFQVNQSLGAIQETIPFLGAYPWAYGLMMTVLVGLVIVGGIRRIANVASAIVPAMAVIYVGGALVILLMNVTEIPAAFGAIFTSAFAPDAAYGGIIGVLVVGFQRAAFSNEAGTGSAAIAHSAARTPYPVREGIVALLEPFIDTVVICTMTALVIVITGAYNNELYGDLIQGNRGAALTSRAMGEQLAFFPYVLSLAVLLFAYSTMISWSYYGERCWAWLFGDRTSGIYRGLFLVFVFLGSVITSTNILNFGDLMILGMAFPNILGVVILSGNVKRELDEYWRKLKQGEIRPYEPALAGD